MKAKPLDHPPETHDPSNNKAQWAYRAPTIINSLIVIMVAVSLLLSFGPKDLMLYFRVWGTLYTDRYLYIGSDFMSPVLFVSPLLTYIFLHGGWLHLFMNSVFLLAFGAPVAYRLMSDLKAFSPETIISPDTIVLTRPFRGSLLFLLFFLLAGVFSGIVFVALHFGNNASVVGASGSVSALMAAAIRIAIPVKGQGMMHTLGPILPLTDKRIVNFSAAIIGLNIFIGLFGRLIDPNGPAIAWDAHIAGYLFGLLVFPLFDWAAQSTNR